jgi:hypothetical protein
MDKRRESMEWQRISREQFQSILDKEIAALTPETVKVFKAYAVPIFEQPCFRSEGHGVEKVFVAARAGDRLLFFDDVEEEFGVGVPDGDGVLRDCGTFGPLIAALRALDEWIEGAKVTN